jgi:hypothetical protein
MESEVVKPLVLFLLDADEPPNWPGVTSLSATSFYGPTHASGLMTEFTWKMPSARTDRTFDEPNPPSPGRFFIKTDAATPAR